MFAKLWLCPTGHPHGIAQRRIQDFHWGGECKRLCAPTHIMSANPKVPYGRGPVTDLFYSPIQL